jgi:hypothetical protein
MRQTIKEIEVNMAYRWFIGYDISESIPHFSTFGKNYTRRFQDTDIFERIFNRILQEALEHGFVDASAVFIDGTHIKASANKKKSYNEIVEKQSKQYQKQLDEEIKKDREIHGKKPLKEDEPDTPKEAETKNIKKSQTDPESGVFHKGEHEKCFAYVTNTACDKNNFVLDYELVSGNVHDSRVFDVLYERLKKHFPQIEVVALDSAYKTPWIMKQIIDDKLIPSVPYKRPMSKEGFFKKYEYVYDEYYDCVICPANQILKYTTTNREGYREFKSDPNYCRNCQYLEKCTQSKNHQKTVQIHLWAKYLDLAEDYRHMPVYRDIYKMRGQTIERVFADAKEKHAMRYTQLRGLQKVKMQVTLTFACMNLKKLATFKRRKGLLASSVSRFLRNISEKISILYKFSDLFQKSNLRLA